MKKISDSQWENLFTNKIEENNTSEFLEALEKIPEHIPKVNDNKFSKKSIFKKINKNIQFNIDSSIDLHLKTKSEAKLLIENFIKTCISDKDKYVLIIHGKGKHSKGNGVLKTYVKHLLEEKFHNVIDWYGVAPKFHGGEGAVIVKLK